MRWQWSIISILPVLLYAEKLPLCNDQCSCNFPNNTEVALVSCNSDVKSVLTNISSWINPATNKSYSYLSLTLHNQNFIKLNFTFPDSDLIYLDLSGNDIYSIRDNVFKDLQSMQVLILSNNDLEILSPDAFKGQYMPERFEPLKSLAELRLDHNRLHSLNHDLFEHTTDLEILDLSNNPLKVLDKPTTIAINSLPLLKELYLGYTGISTLPDYILHTPKYLAILDLSGNPIDKVPSALRDSHNLTTLYLNDTTFVNITKENGFSVPNSIKTLHLCHISTLERIEKESLSGLVELEELHISDNIKLTYLDAFALTKIDSHSAPIWPSLKKLYLENNKLAYLDSSLIARWDALVALDIKDNQWTCECENQWMVDELMPIYINIDKNNSPNLRCGAPVEMANYTFIQLYKHHYKMRCLDYYGAQPDKDAAMLVGVLAGVLIALPVILFLLFAYQRQWFGMFSACDTSAAAYSRRYYSSAPKDEDF